MDTFRINHPLFINGLWAVLGLIALCAFSFARKRRAMERFATANLFGELMPDVSPARQKIKIGLVLAALACVVLGLTDPRWGAYYEEVHRRGMDVVFALDVSRSMLAEDVTPDRLQRAKQYIRDVLEAAHGDRVGLVTFAGDAAVSCPLTVDYGAFRMVLDDVGTRSAARGGTSMGDAIRKAVDAFSDTLKGYKAIIVLSDGEDQDSSPVEAAAKAYEERGVRVYTVGLGDSQTGGRIPVDAGGTHMWLEYQGRQVWSKMNPQTLETTAVAGKGAYIPAGTSEFDLGRFYERSIASVDQREFEATQVQRYRIQFPWLVAPAVIMLLAEALLSDRKSRAAESKVEG